MSDNGREPMEIDASKFSTEIVSVNGFWHWPVNDDGEPIGPTTYVPLNGPVTITRGQP